MFHPGIVNRCREVAKASTVAPWNKGPRPASYVPCISFRHHQALAMAPLLSQVHRFKAGPRIQASKVARRSRAVSANEGPTTSAYCWENTLISAAPT